MELAISNPSLSHLSGVGIRIILATTGSEPWVRSGESISNVNLIQFQNHVLYIFFSVVVEAVLAVSTVSFRLDSFTTSGHDGAIATARSRHQYL